MNSIILPVFKKVRARENVIIFGSQVVRRRNSAWRSNHVNQQETWPISYGC
ncbi:hypothetical protein JI435_405950 [Parastagonospora nodorum SN15]|uniref:Uncharacterized protein n=1 Tax=Phaeosphaeria nodorum (strain SN15 / ATCC MYA-4574 / FGSC 10173) TaxID=321614 RepID=A0A7U2EWS6_PHANO|nr:hypothetical protein JI435_405950 [Parastagonospora nodorum SN15]